MKIISKRTFEVPAQQLWLIVRDPGNMPAWNHKCVECSSLPDARVGDRFNATFQMRDHPHETEGEVLEYVENERIAFRLQYNHDTQTGSVDESFQLKPLGPSRTELVHRADFRNAPLPRWVKIFIGFINLFGRKVGPGIMDNIEDLLKPQ